MALSTQKLISTILCEGEITTDYNLLSSSEYNFKKHIILSGGGSTDMEISFFFCTVKVREMKKCSGIFRRFKFFCLGGYSNRK